MPYEVYLSPMPGKVRCPRCGGMGMLAGADDPPGRLPTLYTCPVCNGAGRVDPPPTPERRALQHLIVRG